MCTSVAEGGRRCTGQHLSLDQHANRAERRRAADRERKSAKQAASCVVPRPHSKPKPIRCTVPRPADIPDGYVHRDTLRKRMGSDALERALNQAGLKMRSEEQPGGRSVWWYPAADILRLEATDPDVQQAVATAEEAVTAKKMAYQQSSRGKAAAARVAQHKADDEMARVAGHPFGKDAEIRRLATPAARDTAADGTPIFVHHDGGWKVLMPYDDACSRREGERFPVLKANGTESFQRVRGVTKVGAHNGVLMGLADVDTSPGPQEQAEINAKRAAEAAQREAAKEAAAKQRQVEKEQRQLERDEARKSLRSTATGDDLAWVGAANIKGVADGSRPPAIWSKTDNDGWVVVAREDEVEGAGIADTGTSEYKVGVHKRGQRHTDPFRGYIIGRAEVGGVTVAVLSKDDPNAPRKGCYSCGGPGPLDEYGYCGC